MRHTFEKGLAALDLFLTCLSSSQDEEATGNVYIIERNLDKVLEARIASEAEISRMQKALENDVWFIEYDMIVIDSGNKHGDSWKATLYPLGQVCVFVSEI